MTHETALKLKNAGFTQHGDNQDGYRSTPTGEDIYIPTLDELVEACGSVLLYVNGKDCRAESIEPVNMNHSDWSRFWKVPFKASTLDEALGKLWLALNGEKHQCAYCDKDVWIRNGVEFEEKGIYYCFEHATMMQEDLDKLKKK